MFNSSEVLTALERALNTSQLYMVYQPIFNLRTQSISGFEALMRWNSPQMGMISPDVFYYITGRQRQYHFKLKIWLSTLPGMWQPVCQTPLYYQSIFPRLNFAILCYPNVSEKTLPPAHVPIPMPDRGHGNVAAVRQSDSG